MERGRIGAGAEWARGSHKKPQEFFLWFFVIWGKWGFAYDRHRHPRRRRCGQDMALPSCPHRWWETLPCQFYMIC